MSKSRSFRRRLGLATLAALLGLPALAWAALPRAGGQYHGLTETHHYRGSVRFVVAVDRAHFVSGTIWLNLASHQGGPGSCQGPGYFTLGPTVGRQISPHGAFNLSGTFAYKVKIPKSPGHPDYLKYHGRASFTGSFSAAGRKVSGTAQEWASGHGRRCNSGPVHYTASLVG